MRTSYLLGACTVVGLQGAVMAQGGWTQVATTGPSPRRHHAMAYDSQRGRCVMFGGENLVSVPLADTWEWNGSTWTQVASTGPAARSSHAMAFDSQRGRTVLYGGDGGVTAYETETWEWDGISWALRSSVGGFGLSNHAMAYDAPRGRTVLVYGNGSVFEWDGSIWTQALSCPSQNAYPMMVYDSRRAKSVVCGLSGLWGFDGVTWAQIASPGTGGVAWSAMAFDQLRDRTVVFGGYSLGTFNSDTTEWDGNSWASRVVPPPPARAQHAMVYDSQRGKTVMFGGWFFTSSGGIITPGTEVLRSDTWEWTGSPGVASSFGSGCGNPALTLAPVTVAPPTVGETASVSLTNIPASLAFVAFGWSRTLVGPFGLPFPLAGYGMPGCQLLQSSEVTAPVQWASPSTATYSLLLPNWSGLIGLHLYLQGWAPAPGTNQAGVIVSNGLEWLIGY